MVRCLRVTSAVTVAFGKASADNRAALVGYLPAGFPTVDGAIAAAQAMARAGADIVFVESPETEAEMVRIGQEIDAPLLANMVEGGRTPILPASRLQAIGYNIAIYPAVGFLAATAALERAFSHLRTHGDSTALPATESYGFGRMCDLLGFPEVWEFERRWADTDRPAGEGA